MQKVVAHPKARALWGTSSWIVKSLKKMLRTKTEFPTTWYFFCYFQSAMKQNSSDCDVHQRLPLSLAELCKQAHAGREPCVVF